MRRTMVRVSEGESADGYRQRDVRVLGLDSIKESRYLTYTGNNLTMCLYLTRCLPLTLVVLGTLRCATARPAAAHADARS